MMVKLVSGNLEYAKKTAVIDGCLVYNPNELALKKLGYKCLVDQRPQVEEDKQYAKFVGYSEDQDNVYVNYTVEDIITNEISEGN